MRKIEITFRLYLDKDTFPDTFEEYSKLNGVELVEAIRSEMREENSPVNWLSNFLEPDCRISVSG